MKRSMYWLVAILLLNIPALVQAQKSIQSTAHEPGSPMDMRLDQLSAIETTAMPQDHIDRMKLDDELEQMRKSLPAFNSVIVRDPGVPDEYPMLPAMTLKNVTVSQFLQFVQASYPGVRCYRIDGPTGSLYSIRISMDEKAIEPPQNAPQKPMTSLYPLRDIIDSMVGPPIDASYIRSHDPQVADLSGMAATKIAEIQQLLRTVEQMTARGKAATEELDKINSKINDLIAVRLSEARKTDDRVKDAVKQVMSLLQTTLDAESNDPYTMKLHEPTLVVMLKGSPAKHDLMRQALDTLRPSARSPFTSGGRGGRGNAPSQQQLEAFRAQGSSLEAQLIQKQAEIYDLRTQLEQERKKSSTTKPVQGY